MNISIIGAGLSGLLAASQLQEARIYEKQTRETMRIHRALLRFRSDQIGKYLGIPFKKVQVNKAIYSEGQFVQPNPRVCNLYAQKVAGMICDRSIWNIEPCTRFIAPENFHEMLMERLSDRIEWGCEDIITKYYHMACSKWISTIPMESILKYTPSIKIDNDFKFDKTSITVRRYKIPNCNVYQTVYFPDPDKAAYRASISGDILIIESMKEIEDYVGDAINYMSDKFGINRFHFIDETTQTYGKIGEMDTDVRKNLIYKLSRDYGIYSLGRFAIWKNVLLDDVWKDIEVIKQLMWKNNYELAKENLG